MGSLYRDTEEVTMERILVTIFLVYTCLTSSGLAQAKPTKNVNGTSLSSFLTKLKQTIKSTFEESDNMECKQPMENLLDMIQQFEMDQSTQIDQSMSKLLILTGYPDAKKVEVVDLQNPLNSCILPEEFPTRLSGAVGGFTKDGPLLCGGYNIDTYPRSNACFTLKDSKFVEADVKLQTERSSASAVVLPNGELWIQGGYDGNSRFSTSERISLEGSQTGMELEKGISSHCSMMINATTAFITGGYTGSSTKDTHFVDIHNWKWTKGPQMEEARVGHGCVLFMHNNHNYALVSGGVGLSSTEILDLDSGLMEWTKGPELPVKMWNFPLVSTSQGIMAVGGYDYTNYRHKDEILHLICQDGQDPNQCQWQEYPKKLDAARQGHVVIPLPVSYEICNN